MLDPTNPSPAYRMGRLFAVLEKIQEEASPGINATIRDRYYGAASSTPVGNTMKKFACMRCHSTSRRLAT